ncbi:hypothetical protein GYMLUDRAFT_252987 [Collybiopsis luxurians FD-317 M1]|uniref:Protein RTA1 n=1 Tax=Collybiopsis luxurians FD-317 M1 TaxID=944289 RepID=A0A0D0BM44_9AGAR|nr:hypothetical protein GYMLUDRAFT_252987 [Collybiopsis luxurians FD-317 M1]
MASPVIDYPKAFGWNSVAAAAVFAALYLPLTAYFIFKIVQERRRVLFTMTLFCLIRVAAFILRAVSLNVESAGENLGLFIAIEVLLQAGFFGLLYSIYTLVVDRLELCDSRPLPIPIIGNLLELLKNRRLFRIALIIPVALSIASINIISNNPTSSTGVTLRKVAAILFLVLTALQVLQSLVLIQAEREGQDTLRYSSSSFGAQHASLIFGLIAILLLIREIFSVATISNVAKANNEHFWYPLVALPELLCAALYTIPGVIPPKPKKNDIEIGSV